MRWRVTLVSISTLVGTSAALAQEAPLTLEQALAEATRGSIELALARAEREVAGVDAYASYAGVLPKLDLSASFGRNYIGSQRQVRVVPVLDESTTPPTISYTQEPVWTPALDFADYSLGLTLRQPVFDGLRSPTLISQASANSRAAEHKLTEETLSVAFDVTRRFYEVVKAERSLAVLEETARQSEELLARSDALYAAGRAPKSDTYAARVNLGNDRINVEAQRARVAQARSDLAVALGRQADPDLAVAAPATLDTAAPSPDQEPAALSALIEKAKRLRPLLASQTELVTAAELGLRLARADWYPVLGASLTYSRQSPTFAGAEGVYGKLSRQYVATAGLFVQWNLFDGRKTLAASERARITGRQAKLTADQAEKLVSNELARARSNVIALARAAWLAQANLASADEGVRLAEERLRAGAATQLEVRDAVLKLTQAKLSLVSARIDHAVAQADLNRAVGGGPYENTP